MKKFQSFNDIENYMKTENVPYTCNKKEILKNLNDKVSNRKHFMYRKTILVCGILLLFISITSVAIAAITLGFIPGHEEYVKSHKGKIISTLSDENGECVFQAGVIDDLDNYNERVIESRKRDEVQKEFEDVSKSLEDKLSDDKVALFIPVRGLDSFIDIQILNMDETYYSIKDMEKNGSVYFPVPKSIPQGFKFSSSNVWYGYEDFYEPYSKELTYKEFLEKLFNEAKDQGKDYYYKEYKRYNTCGFFMLEYRGTAFDNENIETERSIQLIIRKGKNTIISDNNTGTLDMDMIEHNGRKYLVEDNIYYTYFYIDDELWSIEICAPSTIARKEIFKIVESMK